MIEVTQTITTHDPAAGQFGDCFRACIASILELPIEAVPHTMAYEEHLVEDPGQWYPQLNEWLRPRGLAFLCLDTEVAAPADWFRAIEPAFTSYHVLSGLGPRGHNHSVVACNGRLAWDPHPSRAGLVGPMSHNGKWEIGLIVKGGTLA